MKVGIIVKKLNVKGGVQKHVLYEARELQKMGHEVSIYTYVFSKDECYGELMNGLKIISLNAELPRYTNYFSWKTKESGLAKKLALIIDPDTEILNPHDHGCYKVAYYFKKNVNNIPSVWTMHDMPTRAFSAKMSEANGGKKTPFYKRTANYFLDRYEIGKYIKKQDAVAVLNTRDKGFARKYFGKDAEIIRNGVDTERFPFLKRSPSGSKIRLLMNGIFFRHRRFEDGIRAGKILNDTGFDVRLSIAGDINTDKVYHAELLRLVKDLGFEKNVEFLGRVSEEKLRELYKTRDIFLFPNHMQSWGLAVFEAMSAGLPVIISRSAGATEVLTDGKNAIFADPKNPESLARAVNKLAASRALYLKVSEYGRKFVEENISWKRLAENYERIFDYAKNK